MSKRSQIIDALTEYSFYSMPMFEVQAVAMLHIEKQYKKLSTEELTELYEQLTQHTQVH